MMLDAHKKILQSDGYTKKKIILNNNSFSIPKYKTIYLILLDLECQLN